MHFPEKKIRSMRPAVHFQKKKIRSMRPAAHFQKKARNPGGKNRTKIPKFSIWYKANPQNRTKLPKNRIWYYGKCPKIGPYG